MGWLQDRMNKRATNDEHTLSKLGYKQELRRKLTFFHNFAVTFSYLSPITGLTGTYGYLWLYGGPVSIVWGWLLVGCMNFIVGLSMAEICSAYPTSGGVYFWSFQLGGKRNRTIACWIAGWFNLLGQIAASAGVAYTSAMLIGDFIFLCTGGSQGGGFVSDQPLKLAWYAAVLLVLGLVNTLTVRALGIVGEVSVWWHVIGCTLFVILLPLVAPVRQTAQFVFTTFAPDTTYSGMDSYALLFMLSLLGSQWAMVGYDAAAHMAEETEAADFSGPISIFCTIGSGWLVGISFLLSVTFSIQDPARVLAIDNAVACGTPVFGIVYDVFAARYGSGTGSLGLMLVPLICSIFCGLACVTASSRMLYAFSRDGAVPGSRWWRQVHPKFEAPVNAVWLVILLCFILGVPSVHSYTAFAAITSIGVVGLYISYAVPIWLRITAPDEHFKKGPFTLGAWGRPISCVAMLWVCFACVLFILPQVLPVTYQNLNYAPVAVGIVFVICFAYWFVARKWFVGPRRTVDEVDEPSEDIKVDARDPADIKANRSDQEMAGMVRAVS